MSNLTMEKGVVKPAQDDLTPDAGHYLVVYEKTADGKREAFIGVLEPEGQLPEKKRSIFERLHSPKRSYIVYPVNSYKKLDLSFGARVLHMNQHNSFDLSIDIEYCVSAPKLVVTWLETDPLTKLRDKVEKLVKDVIVKEDWQMIKHEFPVIAQNCSDAVLERANEYAKTLGLELKEIGLSLGKLFGKDIELDDKTAEAEAEKQMLEINYAKSLREKDIARRLAEADIQNEDATANLRLTTEISRLGKVGIIKQSQRMDKVNDGVADSTVVALENTAREINSIRQIKEGLEMMGYHSNRQPYESPIAGFMSAPAAEPSYFPKALEISEQVFSIIGKIDCPHKKKTLLLSTLLHLVAEAILGDQADNNKLLLNVANLKDVIDSLGYLPNEQDEFLQSFLDYKSLIERLQ